jgi:hypothetical protein
MRSMIVIAALLLAGCTVNEEAVRRSGWPSQPAPVIVQPAPAPAPVSCGRMGVWVNCW